MRSAARAGLLSLSDCRCATAYRPLRCRPVSDVLEQHEHEDVGLTMAMDHKPATPDATSEAPRKNVGSTLSRCSGPAFCSISCHTMMPVTTCARLQRGHCSPGFVRPGLRA